MAAPLAALVAEELLALARHLRPRLVPGEEPPAPAVARRELGRRLQERLTAEG